MDWLLTMLRTLYQGLYQGLRATQGPDAATALAVLTGLAFAFGVLHVLLPGHQKMIIGTYFLSENANYAQGFLAGGLFALFHVLSATLIPLVIRFGLQMTLGQTTQLSSRLTQTLSFAGVLVIAVVLFVLKLRDLPELRRRAQLADVRRRLGFDLHDRLETAYEPVPWRRLLPILFFAALLPCPDTIVFLAALSMGALGPGLAAVGGMTLGMSATLTAIAISVIAAKKSGRGLRRKTEGWIGVFLLEILGLLLLVLFATLLLPLQGPAGP